MARSAVERAAVCGPGTRAWEGNPPTGYHTPTDPPRSRAPRRGYALPVTLRYSVSYSAALRSQLQSCPIAVRTT